MADPYSFWQFGEELRGLASEDHNWTVAASKLALVEQMRTKGDRINRLEAKTSPVEKLRGGKSKEKPDEGTNNLMNLNWKPVEPWSKGGIVSSVYNANHNNSSSHNNYNNNSSLEKRFKTLPSSEMLPRNEILGGYIFVCNNDTMQEDLKRQLFGLPQRYRDSVRAITPGLPLFLYNYTTHQLHGTYQAVSFGGSNIDPTAWEDKKCKGESRFPAQVRIRVRKVCKPLEEDAFRPVLHHYDGPKFRLQLSVPETLALLDLFTENSL
eukprot:Gb_36297 [translate_table: standard]